MSGTVRSSQEVNDPGTSSSLDSALPFLSQRIVTADSYMCQPNSQFDQTRNEFNQTENHWVPVIRIFGPSTAGQKCCAHIHGVFPYLYVPVPEGISIETLATTLDDALNRGSSTNGRSKNQLKHVVSIVPVRGRTFYGYRGTDEEFFKIYFYTPFAVTKAAQLLANGTVLGRRLQPHESHIPYILQFFMDYNLFGMNLVHFRKLLFRRPYVDEKSTRNDSLKVMVDGVEVEDSLVQAEATQRMTRCDLEFDAVAADILNYYEKRSRSSNPGITAIWQDEIERRRQKGLVLTQDIPSSADRQIGDPVYDAEKLHFDKLRQKLRTAPEVRRYSDRHQQNCSQLQASSQRNVFLPQFDENRSDETFQSQPMDDESVIQFLQEMAREVEEEEEDELSQRSILKSSEFESFDEGAEIIVPTEAEGEKVDIPLEDENWSESFMSQAFTELDELSSDDELMIENPSGSARSEPVFMRLKNIRDTRREWNNEVLESFMKDIMNNKYDPIVFEDDFEDDLETGVKEENEAGNPDPEGSAGVVITKTRVTQAQKLFPELLLRNEPTRLGADSDANHTEMEISEEVFNKHSETGSHELPNVNLLAGMGDIYPSAAMRETDVKPLLRARESMIDVSCQSDPIETSHSTIQTEYPYNGVSVHVSTENPELKDFGTQTDSSTLDVSRTCGCRCSCGLQYMIELKANWEMARKSKDRSCQTDDIMVDVRNPPELQKKKRRASEVIEFVSPTGEKIPKIILDKEIVDKQFPSLNKIISSKEITATKQSTPQSKRYSPKKGSASKWASPTRSSPQIEAATKLLKKRALRALSRQKQHSAERVSLKSDEEIENETNVQARQVDMSITSVYEYETYESPAMKSVRMCASKKGMRLFEYKQQQMLEMQRESSKKRRKRRDIVESLINSQFPHSDIIKPYKRTPQESFIAELVAQDELQALPPVPDYYAESPGTKKESRQPLREASVKFKGGNLSDDDDDEDSQSMTQSQNSCYSPVIANSSSSSPVSRVRSNMESDNSPRSILKGRQKESIARNRGVGQKKIRWGISNPEESEPKSSNESAVSKNSSVSYNPDQSELDGPSLNPFNGNVDFDNLKSAKAFHTHQYLTIMCMELFCRKRVSEACEGEEHKLLDDFRMPDPEFDEIAAIFYEVREDKPGELTTKLVMLAVGSESDRNQPLNHFSGHPELIYQFFDSERSMLLQFMSTVLIYDPDILVGYEIVKLSWGYLLERGHRIGMHFGDKLSRILPDNSKRSKSEEKSEWNEAVPGRIVLNIWRFLRHEITVQSYTFESAMFHVLQERVGLVTLSTLNYFWNDQLERYRTVDFYCQRVKGTMRIIDKLDLINRTSELARLFGIQFFEVFSRGSQYRVESMMIRLAKPDNLIPPSPTVTQRAHMRAPVELPLIMEPVSKIYKDPVAVLDFQSLYPSIIIAYNYDFTTCLGRVEHLGRDDAFDFGCLDLQIDPADIKSLVDSNLITISPTGVAFVKAEVKRGILPEMLQQILDTRIMVKKAMKECKNDNKTLYKVLDSRQLGLKLIANVTYGYTSANFSGRMPLVEVADSVVSKGRETLERAIQLVHDNKERWGAEVVYGDTDSMFIRFPNCDRQTAFKHAQQIVDEVTALNPKPVKLKLEKIYQPCILQTKKRYVGFCYESPNQEEPTYDAKGIETVRRDGCPAVAKILQKALHILFTTDDEQKLRRFLNSQFQKILLGNVSLSDYTFAREYRGRSGYKPGAVVPALAIAERLRNLDRRAEPQPRERVPYVVIYGTPGQTLIHQTRTPREFVEHEDLRINAVYYIERVIIPALSRCFSLAGINVQKWYSELPRRQMRMVSYQSRGQKGILEPFLLKKNCVGCDGKADNLICKICASDYTVYLRLLNKADIISRKIADIPKACKYCTIGVCVSLDCPTWQKLVRYDRVQQRELELLHQALEKYAHWSQ